MRHFWDYVRMKNRIKEYRVMKGLSQEKLADALNTTKQTIGRLEKGKLPLTQDWMERIAPVLGRQPHELIAPDHYTSTGNAEGLAGRGGYVPSVDPQKRDTRSPAVFIGAFFDHVRMQDHDWQIAAIGCLMSELGLFEKQLQIKKRGSTHSGLQRELVNAAQNAKKKNKR